MAKADHLVSVIVSVYNIEERLPRCLESISNQTHRHLEIILIDDGSTDNSGRLCDDFVIKDPRAQVIHQRNMGLYAARNIGVEKAKGDFVVFPDGDDYFHKDYIRLLLEAINLNGKEYPMAFCNYRSVRDSNKIIPSDPTPVFEEMDRTELLNSIVLFPSCGSALWGANWNKIYRKSCLPQPFQKGYRRCQDYDSNLRLFTHIDKAVFVRNVLYHWVQWPGQSTRSSDFIQIRDECRTSIFYDQYMNFPAPLSFYRPYLLDNLYRRLIVWMADFLGTSDFVQVRKKIREYERRTLVSFLCTSRVPFRHKVRWLLSLHAPIVLKLLGKSIPMEMA